VGNIDGHCPQLSFVVSGTTVNTNSSTDFTGGKCSDLSSGDTVDVTGTSGSNDTIDAMAVAITKNKK
jgi:hypothetical protein